MLQEQLKHQVIKTIDLYLNIVTDEVAYDDLVELKDNVEDELIHPVIALSQANAILKNFMA